MVVMRRRGTKNETRMRSKKPKGENAFETAKMSLCTLALTLTLTLTLRRFFQPPGTSRWTHGDP